MSSEHAISSVMVLNVIVAVLKDKETPLKRNLFSLKGKYANTCVCVESHFPLVL